MLHLSHERFCLVILACHDVADTQVGQHNGSHFQQVFQVTLHQRLIEAYCLLETPVCSITIQDVNCAVSVCTARHLRRINAAFDALGFN